MTITASDRVAGVAALVAQLHLDAPAPTEATEVEGRWMLKGQPDKEGAALVVNHYGLRIVTAYEDEDGEIHEGLRGSAAYLTGPAVVDLRHHLRDLWQCPTCGHWMRGPGICAMLCDWEDDDTTAPDPGAEEEG